MTAFSDSEWATALGRKLSWSLVETAGGVLLTVVIYLFLGNLLSANDFGQVAIAMIAANIVVPLAMVGMPEAVVQNERTSAERISSVLWVTAILALFWGAIVWLLAPTLEMALKEPGLGRIVRFLAVLPLFEVVVQTTGAAFKRELILRPLAVRRIAGLLLSGVTSVWLAMEGYGAASLAVFHLLNSAFSAIFLVWRIPVPLRFVISKNEVAALYPYGWHALGLSFFGAVRRRLMGMLIGGTFGVEVLGLYAFADRMASLFQEAVGRAVQQFAFPLFSKIQKDQERLSSVFHRAVEWVAGLSLLVYGGLAWLAPDVLEIIFGDKWQGAGWLVPILVIGYLAESMQGVLEALGRAAGHPRVILVNRLYSAILFVLVFIWVASYGLYALFLCVGLSWLILMPLLFRRLYRKMGWNLNLKRFRVHVPIIALLAMLGTAMLFGSGEADSLIRIILVSSLMALVYLTVWVKLHPCPWQVITFWRQQGNGKGD